MRAFTFALIALLAHLRRFAAVVGAVSVLGMSSVVADAQTSTQTILDQCLGGRQPRSYEEAISLLNCQSQLIYGDCDNLPNEYYIDVCLKAKDYTLALGQTYLAMMHNAKSQTEKDAILRMYGTADKNGHDQFLATIRRLNNLYSRFVNQQGEFSPERLRALSPPPAPPPQVVVVPSAPAYQPPPSLHCTSNRVGDFTYTNCQ